MNKEQVHRFVEEVTAGIYRDHPELLERFGERGREKCREDNHHHFRYLKTAYELENSSFFTDYAHWLTNLLAARGMEARHVTNNFQRLSSVLADDPSAEAGQYKKMLAEAIVSIEGRETV